MSSTFTKQQYIDYIKLNLTGDTLVLEICDQTIGKFVDAALLEVQRYIDETKLVTVPFSRCIDLTDWKHSAITHVYRTEGFGSATSTSSETSSWVDPMYAQKWMVFSSGGTSYNLNNYIYNYMAYSTLMQIENTTSTDLAFKEDKHDNKLYINCAYDVPKSITIEYVPLFESVDEVTSDYWIDILKRLALAMTKIALGRIRTRFTQSNALWTQDGEHMLQEGNDELKELRNTLQVNSTLFYPID